MGHPAPLSDVTYGDCKFKNYGVVMTRRQFGMISLLAGLGLAGAKATHAAAPADPGFFQVIDQRHSVRSFTAQPVSDADVETMLRCAMRSPSAANEQPWEFVVIRDKSLLEQVGDINHWATYAKNAPVSILVCLNTQKEKEKGMGIIDIGMCSENILLAATALGLGAVFTGIYPYQDRMDGFSKLFSLPDYIQPVGLIVIGHPKSMEFTAKEEFNPKAIHQNKWQDN